MLEVFLAHRFEVVRRRSAYRRAKAADRLHLVEGLLLAILDIDEVIQLIRGSDNAEHGPRAADVGLRPDRGPGQLHPRHAAAPADQVLQARAGQGGATSCSRTIEELDEILGDDAAACAPWSPTSWPRSPRPTARRGVRSCSSPSGRPRTTAAHAARGGRRPLLRLPLLLRPARPHDVADARACARGRRRARHDVIVSAVATTARGEVGVVTSRRTRGQARRARPADAAERPPTTRTSRAVPPSGSSSTLEGERVLALTGFAPGSPGLALGTRQGVVKRVNPEYLSARDDWDVIALKDGDEVVGAVELRTGEETLCFVTSDAQLLHFGAGQVRPQGRSGGGIAGIKLAAGAPGGLVHGARPARAPSWSSVSGASSAPAGHRGRLGQGDAVRGVPRQGAGHRRRALPPLPQGRGRAGLRLGRGRSRARGRGQRRAGRPARADRAARRVGQHRAASRSRRAPGRSDSPCHPAVGSRSRTGHRRSGRLSACRTGVPPPCSPPSWPACSRSPAAAGAAPRRRRARTASPASVMAAAKKHFDDASSIAHRAVDDVDALGAATGCSAPPATSPTPRPSRATSRSCSAASPPPCRSPRSAARSTPSCRCRRSTP